MINVNSVLVLNPAFHQTIWLTSSILTVFTLNTSGIPSDTKQILSLIEDMKVLTRNYSAKLTNLETLVHNKSVPKVLDKYRSQHSDRKQGLKILSKMPNNESLDRIMVKAKLPKGLDETLVLNRFYHPERKDKDKHCNYVGYLKSNPTDSVAALTGCIGKQNVMTSLLSFKNPKFEKMHLWKLNGEVKEIHEDYGDIMDIIQNDDINHQISMDLFSEIHNDILDELSSFDHHIGLETETNSNDYDPAVGPMPIGGLMNDISNVIPIPSKPINITYCALELKGNIHGLIPSNLTFEITASYEDNFLAVYNYSQSQAEEAILKTITMAQTHFLHPSLGTKIHLKLMGPILYLPNERLVADGPSLSKFQKLLQTFVNPNLDHATHALFTSHGLVRDLDRALPSHPKVDNRVGIANVWYVCFKPYKSLVIIERGPSERQMVKILMHELGHALGMAHNINWSSYKGIPKGICQISKSSKYQSIMRGKTSKPYAWTICNRCDLLRQYQKQMIKWGKYCLAKEVEEQPEQTDIEEEKEEEEDNPGDWSEFELESLKRHNELRKKHGSPPMKLSRELCTFAQNWVNRLANEDKMYHSSGSGFGENIFFQQGSECNMKIGITATNLWYNEVSMHNYSSNQFVYETGHFTQVVWKNSTELGIAKAVSGSGKCYVSANYKPPGNYEGQFIENVLPPIN